MPKFRKPGKPRRSRCPLTFHRSRSLPGFRFSIFRATEWPVSHVPHLPVLSQAVFLPSGPRQAGWAKHLIRDIAIVLAAWVHDKSTGDHKAALSHQVSSSVPQSPRLRIASKGTLHLQRAGAVSGSAQGTLETPAILPRGSLKPRPGSWSRNPRVPQAAGQTLGDALGKRSVRHRPPLAIPT